MKTMLAIIMISLLTVSCGLLQGMPEDICGDHCCDGINKLSRIERQRLADRTGIPLRVWDNRRISVSMALTLKQRYQLVDAYYTNPRSCEP